MTATQPAGWVTERYGLRLVDDGTSPRRLDELAALGLRRNPRRAYLLVSGVLGKHVPVEPTVVRAAGVSLGELVREALGGVPAAVLGYAETATALGHLVAETIGAPYLHSTRRSVATARPYAAFEEEHSHATSHLLLPDDVATFEAPPALVLVDDELSTGRTVLNTIAALHALRPRERYVVAALIDVRPPAQRGVMAEVAARLGVQISVVALASGELVGTATPVFPGAADAVPAGVASTPADVIEHRGGWPVAVREGGRHGYPPADVGAAHAAAGRVAAQVRPALAGTRVHVLGTEELMYAPLLIAEALDAYVDTVLSSTTRSPVVVCDEPGYPVRSALRFPAHEDHGEPGERYAYNVDGADDVVVVVDEDGDTAALRQGLLTALRSLCRRVHLVVLPCHRPAPPVLRGPEFGSYRGDDVGWLLTDLSTVPLEAPVEEREEAVQSGGAHYAESLPIEYQPDDEYLALFEAALRTSAARVAHAVGVVTELVLAERGRGSVLVSLARAGTPVGVLMRRWAQQMHGVDLPHYAVSIVRGRGIDTVALRALAGMHDPARVVFVDGWTGKGAITRELAAAVAAANATLGTAFSSELTVLADPGACVSTFGTRDDFLVPSACLNSTVSGLVSRTVLNPTVLAPGQFHGAKYYRELGGADVSGRFIDAVAACFDDVADAVLHDPAHSWRAGQRADRAPTWSGEAAVRRIAGEYGIDDLTLIKPGVGETTRVLLRRVPWLVLVNDRTDADVAHILLLAERRGVDVREARGLGYRSVGIIHPRFTRGATGADGRAAR